MTAGTGPSRRCGVKRSPSMRPLVGWDGSPVTVDYHGHRLWECSDKAHRYTAGAALMRSHLYDHLARGHTVPDATFDRLAEDVDVGTGERS